MTVVSGRNPRSPHPVVRLEKRAGKTVTVVAGLATYGAGRLERIARYLKTALGAGGTVKNGTIEIQGEKTAAVRKLMEELPER